jgi:hypothetical protein
MVSQPNKSFSIEELAASIIALLDEERMPILETYPTEHVPDRVILLQHESVPQFHQYCHGSIFLSLASPRQPHYDSLPFT